MEYVTRNCKGAGPGHVTRGWTTAVAQVVSPGPSATVSGMIPSLSKPQGSQRQDSTLSRPDTRGTGLTDSSRTGSPDRFVIGMPSSRSRPACTEQVPGSSVRARPKPIGAGGATVIVTMVPEAKLPEA